MFSTLEKALLWTTLALSIALAASPSIRGDEPENAQSLSMAFVKNGKNYKLEVGEERVIVRGIRPEEQLWGPYQFPRPYDLGDRFVVSVHVSDDNISSYANPYRWFESRDKGATWTEVDPSVADQCGTTTPSGDRLLFPLGNAFDVSSYRFTAFAYKTPATDYSVPAKEGSLPVPDGMTAWMGDSTIYAFDADRLPPSLRAKVWRARRLPKDAEEAVDVEVPIEWKRLTRVVHESGGKRVMKALYPRGNLKLGPDGALWVSAFSGEGHIDPDTGWYSPYYSAELFRSEDDGRSFQQRSHLEYPADGKEYPYASGGFSDSDFEFMPDGSMVWAFRSNWYATTGEEWSPTYIVRSTDMGRTWSKPERFTPIGTLPRFCRLGDFTLFCFARPGMFVKVCLDDSGIAWSEPLELMTSGDRSKLANVPIEHPKFHDWDGSCNNPEMLRVDDKTALIFYSDFYYPDEDGVKRKTILCRTLTIVEE